MRSRVDPCDGITRSARLCERRARFFLLNANCDTVGRYCSQHWQGYRPSRLLRPYPWTYSRVFDRVTNRFLDEPVPDWRMNR